MVYLHVVEKNCNYDIQSDISSTMCVPKDLTHPVNKHALSLHLLFIRTKCIVMTMYGKEISVNVSAIPGKNCVFCTACI